MRPARWARRWASVDGNFIFGSVTDILELKSPDSYVMVN